MRSEDRFLEIHRNPLFPWLMSGLSVLLITTGFHLSFFRPRALVAHAMESATARIDEARETQQEAVSALQSASWFRASYFEEAIENIKVSESLLREGERSAEKLVVLAETGSWRKRLAELQAAESAAATAQHKSQQARAIVWTALQRKQEAFDKRSRVLSGITEAEERIVTIDKRGSAELPRYPSRYGKLHQQRRNQTMTSLAHLKRAPQSFEPFLPPEESVGSGDPLAALTILDQAVTLTESIDSSSSRLIAWLDEIAHGYEQADQKVAEAERSYNDTRSGLAVRRNRTGYWLKAAGAILADADSSRQEGRRLLTAIEPEETVPDRPQAFHVSNTAIKRCREVLANADAEIALANSVNDLNTKLLERIDVLVELVPNCEAQLGVVQTHHHRNAWASYADILERSGKSRAIEHRFGHREVARLTSTDVQEFAQADQLVRRHLDIIDRQIADARRFIDHVRDLERMRAEYNEALRAAESVVSSNRSNVDSYGSYDSSAERAFKKALRALEEAGEFAGVLLYAEALASVRNAANLARGTGERAYEAYQDEQRRRARADDDDSFGWSFGSGSDSGGGSGGTIGSGSSWGGGSDSGWSGGSDSSWRSGSDSDW